MAMKKAGKKSATGKTIQVTLRLPEEEWQKLAHLAVDQRTSIQSLLEGAVNKLFKAHGIAEYLRPRR